MVLIDVHMDQVSACHLCGLNVTVIDVKAGSEIYIFSSTPVQYQA
jgi:hypothetical protein